MIHTTEVLIHDEDDQEIWATVTYETEAVCDYSGHDWGTSVQILKVVVDGEDHTNRLLVSDRYREMIERECVEEVEWRKEPEIW